MLSETQAVPDDAERSYPPDVIEAAARVMRILDDGCDRCHGGDLTLLERHGLMIQMVCSDTFGQDSIEIGETMWVFSAAGNALCESLPADKEATDGE